GAARRISVVARLGVRGPHLPAVAAELERSLAGHRRGGAARAPRPRADPRAHVPAPRRRSGAAALVPGRDGFGHGGTRAPPAHCRRALALDRRAPGTGPPRTAPEVYRTEKEAVYGAAHRAFELFVALAGDE